MTITARLDTLVTLDVIAKTPTEELQRLRKSFNNVLQSRPALRAVSAGIKGARGLHSAPSVASIEAACKETLRLISLELCRR